MSHRVFIAINLSAEVKNELEAFIFDLQKQYRGMPIKWVERQNLHLTLHFLGSQSESGIEQINQLLAKLVPRFSVLNLQLSECGVFPYLARPRVIYIALKETKGETLRSLQKNLGEELEKIGIKVDHRLWQPHITLGRIKAPVKLKLPEIDLSEIKFEIKTVDLVKSDLQPRGPNYIVLEKFKLNDF